MSYGLLRSEGIRRIQPRAGDFPSALEPVENPIFSVSYIPVSTSLLDCVSPVSNENKS